jgi:uncharacterized protein (DUF1778 family)
MKASAKRDLSSRKSGRTTQRRSRAKTAAPKAKSPQKPRKKPAQAERLVAPKSTAKTAVLNMRIDAETRDLVDRAANASGQNRTDFMLTVLREKSIEVLLNRRLFLLDDADWIAFVERLDDPPPPNAKLKALLAREPVWDQ